MSMRVQVMGYDGYMIMHSWAASVLGTPAVIWGG